MKKILKCVFSFLLILVLTFGVVPTTASAATNITGTWETDFVFPAADLGVQANDAVFRCCLTFGSNGSVSASWTAVDLSAIRLYFHQMFVNAYYACAYCSGITDLEEVERTCVESTGMSVSAYMFSILDAFDMNTLFTPAPESGVYAIVNGDLHLDMSLMGNPSDPDTPNPIVRSGSSLEITAASFGQPGCTLTFRAVDAPSKNPASDPDDNVVDLTFKLNVLMHRNARILEDFLEEHGYVKAALFYHAMVTDGGDWDIKLTDEWKFEPGKTYVYQGKVMRMDDPGNIHFGYTGAILFPEEFVCFGAGMNNLLKFGFTAGDLSSYYDDPQDQEMMRWGYRMYKAQH